MPQPTPYDRQANFSNEEALNPTGKTPGVSLDSEFNAIKQTSDETLRNLALLQRDDGALKNGVVTSDSLSPSLSIGFTLRGSWVSGVNYILNDGVSADSKFFRATASHLSSPSNAPGQPGAPWLQVADFDAAAAAAGAAATEATLAAVSANVVGGNLTAAVRWDATQSLTDSQKAQARANIGATAGGKNLLINASFRVNQRGFAGGALAAGVYGHDRWKAAAGGANYSVAAGVATIASGSIVQVIEGASIEFTETFVINWTGTATCTVDGVAKNKGDTFTLTAGTNASIVFATGTLSKPQVEPGTVVSEFERRVYASELALCQRYFEAFGGGLSAGQYCYVAAGAAESATQAAGNVQFRVEKRAAPTITFVGTTANFIFQTKATTPVSSSTPVVLGGTTRTTGFGLRYIMTGLTAGDGGFNGLQLDAAIWVDAEL